MGRDSGRYPKVNLEVIKARCFRSRNKKKEMKKMTPVTKKSCGKQSYGKTEKKKVKDKRTSNKKQ